jgi:hypothetical protein
MEVCALCEKMAELQLSHIMPAFVFRWLKQEGPIRLTAEINRRVQDGVKAKLLCAQCEALLCSWESKFANDIFYPLASDSSRRLNYDTWLLRFCVSVSWRALLYMRSQKRPTHFSVEQVERANAATAAWGQFLREERPNPGQFENHILILDAIEQLPVGVELPPNINRYFLRGVEIDAAANDSTCFVYSKLGRVVILGFIQLDRPKDWDGTKVRVRHGVIEPRQYVLPRYFVSYLLQRSQSAWEAMGKISKAQDNKVQANIVLHADKVINSDVFRALQQDIRFFGNKAFRNRD